MKKAVSSLQLGIGNIIYLLPTYHQRQTSKNDSFKNCRNPGNLISLIVFPQLLKSREIVETLASRAHHFSSLSCR
jgi:hypothetical protein